MRPFTGSVAFTNRPTTDGRTVTHVTFRDCPIPVMQGDAIAGRIDAIELLPDGSVHATGQVALPPGEYGCGVDLDPANGGQIHQMDDIRGMVMALHVYTDPGKAAWPDARITVTCEHDECYSATTDDVPGDQGVCCDCGAVRPRPVITNTNRWGEPSGPDEPERGDRVRVTAGSTTGIVIARDKTQVTIVMERPDLFLQSWSVYQLAIVKKAVP